MSLTTFFPADALSSAFVLGLAAWFAFWLYRIHAEATKLDSLSRLLANLDGCIEQLRAQQLWRDRQRINGNNVAADPAQFFNSTCVARLAPASSAASILLDHFRAIFVAGCDESALDAAELNAQTCEQIANKPEQLRNELLLMLLLGGLGTLLALSRHYAEPSLQAQRALPPLIWGALMTIAGGVLYLQFQRHRLAPLLAELRRKTTTLWIPRLYPTVAQRAAQWAIHTLHNAARAADASEVIKDHALQFVGAIETARQAADVFSAGMREFSRGIDASDHAIQNAQAKLGLQIDKFADSLGRWSKFEDEIRGFYTAVERHQSEIGAHQKSFEFMLSGYYDLVRQSTNVLQQSASDIGAVAKTLPQAFQLSADKMSQTAADFQQYLAATVTHLSSELRSGYSAESAAMQSRLGEIVAPILTVEDRLRSLSTPFESAANNLLEVAHNLWRLNYEFEQKVARSLIEQQSVPSRAIKSGT